MLEEEVTASSPRWGCQRRPLPLHHYVTTGIGVSGANLARWATATEDQTAGDSVHNQLDVVGAADLAGTKARDGRRPTSYCAVQIS
jgi:hypothetical protein